MPGIRHPVHAFRRLPDLLDPYLRLTMGLAGLLVAIYMMARGIVWIWPLTLGAIYLVWDFFRNAGVWSAFRAFREGRIEVVRQEVNQIRWSNLLSPVSRSYYHWLRGAVDAADGRYAAARVHLLVAAAGSLKTENDRALVQCLLAETAFQNGQPDEAATHGKMAAALSTHPQISRLVGELSRRIVAGR
ncbi:hypothetical protein [Thiohalomonas denitrificans]|uniref:hypothetical protein n=1 Tax=Thiohalomonas denitrificans TaxID=415747 RepID=UPI0026F2515C|nr:hypothetical protein [Thiohalomonas denitrificans]